MNSVFSQIPVELIPLIVILAIWSLVMKALALYRAGKLRQKGWFTALLVINSVGILELIYLLIISKRQNKQDNKDLAN